MRLSLRVTPGPVTIAGFVAGIGLVALLALTCAPDPAPAPPAVVTRAESAAAVHQVATAVDTTAVRQLREQAAAALAARLQAERGAARARALADSLAAVARLQGDSAREWRGAYDARTEERDSLAVALAAADTALARTDSALTRTERRAARGDSALATVLLGMRALERRNDRRTWREKLRPKLCTGPGASVGPAGRVSVGWTVSFCWTIP